MDVAKEPIDQRSFRIETAASKEESKIDESGIDESEIDDSGIDDRNSADGTNNDANSVGVRNGNFFGLTCSTEAASLVFLSVPWDVTTSYGEGTAKGPEAMLAASYQLDLYDFDVPNAWEIGYGTLPISAEIKRENSRVRVLAKAVIDHLEAGGKVQDAAIQPNLIQVNQASAALNEWVYAQTTDLLAQGKLIGVVGGDHSVPLGYMQALAEKHESYGILQIDAHADLRQGFEGFTYSHASIMHNALQLQGVSRLVQVGIRDVCEAEMRRIRRDRTIVLFDDWQLKDNAYAGVSWARQCENIVATLPQKVYVSFDIDGLSPEFCAHTGTPVPGGLDFNQALYLLKSLVKAGKTIIGFDLCEVAPGASGEWDGNVGARLLYKLANFTCFSQTRS
ncbi:MAG: agmatinase family protein [Phormidesmis sp. RL_2_1]|nr:agmatinase family protein [Phormidesmis sp. RL_2_1]